MLSMSGALSFQVARLPRHRMAPTWPAASRFRVGSGQRGALTKMDMTGDLSSVQLAVSQQDIGLGVVAAIESFAAFKSQPRLAGAIVPGVGLASLVALVVTAGMITQPDAAASRDACVQASEISVALGVFYVARMVQKSPGWPKELVFIGLFGSAAGSLAFFQASDIISQIAALDAI